jgi:hypothetical protein
LKELFMTESPRIPFKANLLAGLLVALVLFPLGAEPLRAQGAAPIPTPDLTYVDLVELKQSSDMVVKVMVEDQVRVPPERAPGLAPGQVRLYVEAITQALLSGNAPVGETLNFLVDVPLNAKGKAPDLEEMSFLLFARRVEGRPGEIQLAGPEAMFADDPVWEQRVRQVLTQVVQGEQWPAITGVHEVMSVPGNLAGESETQIFLETRSGAPAALTVLRRPGMAPSWGVSWTDIVDQSARAPLPETLEWYALACFLPAELPDEALIQRDSQSRQRAREDYALVIDQIGACARSS